MSKEPEMRESLDLDTRWREAGRQRFEAAYAPEAAIYERLTDDIATR